MKRNTGDSTAEKFKGCGQSAYGLGSRIFQLRTLLKYLQNANVKTLMFDNMAH